MDTQLVRYPDPAIRVLDPSFARYRIGNAGVERLATGFRWAEGPVWFGDGRCLLWSDIPNNRIMRWDEETGAVSVFRKPSNYANGNTRDRQGRLVTCEHDAPPRHPHRVRRHDHRARATASRASGSTRPTTSSCKSDGSIWFTDPAFGILGNYEGHKADAASCRTNVYRVDPATRQADASWPATSTGPTGSASRPTSRKLYVVEAAAPRRATIQRLRRGRRRHRLANGARLRRLRGRHARRLPLRHRRQPLVRLGHGGEGLDGVAVFTPDGKLIGRIHLPERCANLCFGGAQAQPAVHGRQPVALLALRQHAGRAGRLSRCRPS